MKNEETMFNEHVEEQRKLITSNVEKEKEKVEKLLSTPNETEIMPLYSYMLCNPYSKNPFNTIVKSEGGLLMAGEGDIFNRNTDTGELEEADNIMEVAVVMAVGPDVKYVKEGDVIYYRAVQKTPIPFFRSGLIAVNEHSVMSVINSGLTQRFEEIKSM